MPILSAYLLKHILALPGTLFCSRINVLYPNLWAAYITGPVTYPPTPTTISGLNSLIIFLHVFIAFKKQLIVLKLLKIFFLSKPYISIVLNGISYLGTISFSILLCVPIYKNSLSGSFSFIFFNIDKAGYI